MEPLQLSLSDGWLRDNKGRTRVFRGINTGDACKMAPYVPFDFCQQSCFAQQAYEFFLRIQGLGFNVVRLPFVWEAVEPSPGVYEETYLERLRELVRAARDTGLYVLLDCHQDLYGRAFGGDGFPEWSHPPAEPCGSALGKLWFLEYGINLQVRRAFHRFWHNEDDLLDRFAAMWRVVIETLADEPNVLGVELLNEPAPGFETSFTFNGTLRRAFDYVRESIGPIPEHWFMWYGTPGTEAVSPWPLPLVTEDQGALLNAIHLYDPHMLLGEESTPVDVAERITGLGELQESGMPLWITETGVHPDAKDGRVWLQRLLDRADSCQLSLCVWEGSTSTREWNGEDLSLLTPCGQYRHLAQTVARPFFQALAGEDPRIDVDQDRVQAHIQFWGRQGTTEVRIPRLRVGPSFDVVGAKNVADLHWDPSASLLCIRPKAVGETSLTLQGLVPLPTFEPTTTDSQG